MSLHERISKAKTENGISGTNLPFETVSSLISLDEIKRKIHSALVEELGPELYDLKADMQKIQAKVEKKLQKFLAEEETPLSISDKAKILKEVMDNILGYGPIEQYLKDPEITEIMVNNSQAIYIEKFGKIYPTQSKFMDEAHLMRIIDKIVAQVGRRIDEGSPYVDARLPDGSRVNAIIHPLAINGPMLTIRKFAANPYMVDDLIGFGTLTREVSKFLEACVGGRLNMVVSGGTGSGKTTLLNVLSSFVSGDERVVTIEDSAELQLHQEHVLRLESRPPNIENRGQVTIRDLVRNTLRMRPDRIIVGEVRGAEALDMLQAMNTGHDGSITTVHSNSPRDTLARMETMVLMAGMELPLKAIREQISSAINLIVHLARLRDGTRRITHVTEVQHMEGDIITLQDLFLFDFGMGVDEEGRFRGKIKSTGIRPQFADRLLDAGITLPADLFGFESFARDSVSGR